MEGIFEFRFIADGQLRPIDLIEDIVSAGQKLASLRCECDLSSDPVEESGAQLLLQQPDLYRDSRLRIPQAPGCL